MAMTTEDVQRQLELSKQWIESVIDNDMLDEDGYPTEDALKIIQEWTFEMDYKEWFDFIHRLWYNPDWGWSEGEETHDWDKDKMIYRYKMSTGGWSGNEDVIYAMQQNKYFLWSLTWVQSRRGGHYIFERKLNDE